MEKSTKINKRMAKKSISHQVAGRYRKIEVQMWGDEKFCALSRPAACGQSLWIYLLCGPSVGRIPGIYRAGCAALAEELDWTPKDFLIAFQEVYAKGIVKANWKARVIYIPNAIFHNMPSSPKVIIGWAQEWNLIPECDLKFEAYYAMKACLYAFRETFGKTFEEYIRKPIGKTMGKSMAFQEQEQEQEQEQDLKDLALCAERKILRSASSGLAMQGFAEFYSRYPRKKSKADAEKAWRSKKLANEFEKIMADLEQREQQDPGWNRNNCFVPYPASYLRSRAFEDEIKILSGSWKPAEETENERLNRRMRAMLGVSEQKPIDTGVVIDAEPS